MRRICITIVIVVLTLPCLAKDILCATWNMKWFPSGRADLRQDDFFEETITADNASKIIHNFYCEMATNNDAEVIFFAQEMRDRECCVRLVDKCDIPNLKIAAISDFRDNAGVSIWQQSTILSTLPVLDAGFKSWQGDENVDIPRGFAFAVFKQDDDSLIACFCVHLKSNINHGNDPIETQRNIYKREVSAPQILTKLSDIQKRYGERLSRVIVAGDFNTNDDEQAFVSESTLRSFYGAHFRNCFSGVKKQDRVTHPGMGKYPDATFDYILYRGFGKQMSRRIFPGLLVSDHNLVAIRLR